MQKEKQVKSYTRRTKSGKTVTVRAHTAKYDAAEEVKKVFAKKKGAGEELEDKKSKKAMDLIDELKDLHDKEKSDKFTEDKTSKKLPKSKDTSKTPAKVSANKITSTKSETKGSSKKSDTSSEITAADYKAWYHWDIDNDPKNKTALKVQKALKAKMGASAYRKYFNELTDGYSSRGHISAFKKLSAGDSDSASSKKLQGTKTKGAQKGSKPISKKPTENLVKGGKGVVTNVTGGGSGPHGGGVKRKLHPNYTGVAIYETKRGIFGREKDTRINFEHGELRSHDDYVAAQNVSRKDPVLRKAISNFKKDMRSKYGNNW